MVPRLSTMEQLGAGGDGVEFSSNLGSLSIPGNFSFMRGVFGCS